MKINKITNPIIKFLNQSFLKIGFDFERIRTIHPWENDPQFKRLVTKIAKETVVDRKRLYILQQTVKTVAEIDGEVIELGTYKGGTAYLIGTTFNNVAPKKKIYLFDTFDGLPEINKKLDMAYKGNEFQDTSLESVVSFLKPIKNIKFYKGLFKDTLPKLPEKKFCFAHIDADLYQSVKESCEFLYPKTVSGGVWIFDDYGFKKHDGAKKAVDDFFKDKNEKPILLPTGQAILFKQ